MDLPPGLPATLPNWIDGAQRAAASGETFEKRSPASGEVLLTAARSRADDVARAVAAAQAAQPGWDALGVVARGDLLRELALAVRERAEEVAAVVASETGMAPRQARGEVQGAFELGMFMAGEGRRYYGKTASGGPVDKGARIVRQPVGVAGLIIAANTPIANVAWKVFPALLCGNGVVLKAAEDTPATAWIFGELAARVLPAGALNIVQGLGAEAGAALAAHADVDLVSFTGSYEAGLAVQRAAAARLAKTCLELGGKNPLVVCDDADLELAVDWAVRSAFSNAGQRCAAGSRLVVFDAIYDAFRERLLAATAALRVGPDDEHDLGPVINARSLERLLGAIEAARAAGAEVLCGGHRLTGEGRDGGYYLAPTIVEGAEPAAPISRDELFGPLTCLYRVRDFHAAVALANDCDYGLTAAIHTRSLHRAEEFARQARCGVVCVNGGTFGSGPHMPFGGLKRSGSGWREPGSEALDVYSELKTIYTIHDRDAV